MTTTTITLALDDDQDALRVLAAVFALDVSYVDINVAINDDDETAEDVGALAQAAAEKAKALASQYVAQAAPPATSTVPDAERGRGATIHSKGTDQAVINGVPCRTCKSKAGEPCRNPSSGKSYYDTFVHVARRVAYGKLVK